MKRSARQLSIDLIVAEMVVMQIDIDAATSIVSRSHSQVAEYVTDLYDNKAIKTGEKFRQEILKSAAPGMRM
jgi:hypothetical protein